MRVLITGSSGRIGRAVSECVSGEHRVVGLDVTQGPTTTVVGDITDREVVRRLCAEVDAVIHTASLHAPHVEAVTDEEFRRVNVSGTEVLLEACLGSGVSRFLYTSTTSLYGDAMLPKGRAVWVTEDLAPIPRDIYDETKIAAEELCARVAVHGLTCVSLRMSRCFPEPERLMADYRLYRGVDSRDVAQAHLLALTAQLHGFEVFNTSAEPPFDRSDLEELLSRAGDVIVRYFPWAAVEYQKRGWRLPRSIDRVYVIQKAREKLGYAPEFNFQSLFLDRS